MRICVRISSAASCVEYRPRKIAVGLDHALALRARQHERRVQREHQRRVVVARIAVRDVAADRALVAHLRIGDPARALDQQRHLLGQQLRIAADRARWSWRRCGSRCRPARCRAARRCGRGRSGARGCAKRSFIIGSRLWPPASSLASGPRLAEQLDGVGDGTRRMVVEGGGNHRVSLLRSLRAGWTLIVTWEQTPTVKR